MAIGLMVQRLASVPGLALYILSHKLTLRTYCAGGLCWGEKKKNLSPHSLGGECFLKTARNFTERWQRRALKRG